MEFQTTDFLPQFKAIRQSLKKRFFRKPNIADAIEQYENLSGDLQREGQYEFAGMCVLEGAKCHETLTNELEQANSLMKASQLFLKARNPEKLFEINGKRSITAELNLMKSIQSMDQAIKIYKSLDLYGLAFMITVKMAVQLYEEKIFGDAQKAFKSALEIAKTNFTSYDQLIVLDNIVKCKIKTTDYDSALTTVTDTLSQFHSIPEDQIPKAILNTFLLRFQILRVLLLLILKTETIDMTSFIWPQSILPQTSQSTSTGSTHRADEEREEALDNLKSLVIAVEKNLVNEINGIRYRLINHLTETEHELFSILINLGS